MTALRKILLSGGPDAASLRVVDADTGEQLAGVVKIELLCVPGGGALVNVTQACQIESINLVARDAGEPLIDLPDDHPEVKAAEGLNAVVERVRAVTADAFKVPAPAADARQQALDAAGVRPRAPSPAPAAVAVQVVPPKATRHRRTKAEMITARTPAPAPIPEPPPLPQVPGEGARRAPPPESSGASMVANEPSVDPVPDMVRAALAAPSPLVPDEPEPDLSEPEKGELAQLLAKAVAEAKADEPRATLPPGTPWPFDSTPRLGSLLGKKGGR